MIYINLSNTVLHKTYIIKSNTSSGLLKERLLSLGFIEGSNITKIKSGYKGINIYLIKGMMIALRDDEADFICVI